MGIPRAFLAVLAAATLLAAPALGHTPGAQPVERSGSLLLHADFSGNCTFHAYLTDFDLPISVGDTLQMNWAVENGSGTPIEFEIHAHAGPAGFIRYYNRTASSLNDSWKVPDNSTFMVCFGNPRNFEVNVSYSFVLHAPPPDVSLVLFLLPATFGLALGWFFYVRATRPDGHIEPAEGAADAEAPTGEEAKGGPARDDPPPGP
jgi:hypothetical protein